MLLPTAGAARHARDLITDACARWRLPHLIGPAGIVTTELVTNAAVHAGTLIDLQLIRGPHHLLILVGDGSIARPARPRRGPPAVHLHPDMPRGLIIVDATADHWGYRRATGGKTIWAALRTSQPSPR